MVHILIYLFALISLSTAPNWAKFNQMPAEVLGFWRLFVAASVLFVFVIYQKRISKLKFTKNMKWVAISGFFFFLHLWTYKFAAKNTLISNLMILFASSPIWASMGGVAFFKEKLKRRTIVSYFIGLCSILYMFSQTSSFTEQQSLGNWSAIVSAFLYAIYMLAGKKARQTNENLEYAFYQYLICAGCFLIASFFTRAPLVGFTSSSWWAVLGLVLLPTLTGHFSLTFLVKKMDISVLTCGKLIEPIIASLMAYFIFNEHLNAGAWVSFLLTCLAVIILFWPEKVQN